MPQNKNDALRHVKVVRTIFRKHNPTYKIPAGRSEAWHKAQVRAEMTQHVLRRTFRSAGRNKADLIRLLKNFEKNFDTKRYKTLDAYIKQRQLAHPKENVITNLLRELKIAQKEIDTMASEVRPLHEMSKQQKLDYKKRQMDVTRSGLNNILLGIGNYIELSIDHLEKQQASKK